MSILFWTGKETFLIKEKKEFWTKSFIEKHDEFNVSNLDAQQDKLTKIISDIETIPFLAEKRLIFIKNIPPSSKDKSADYSFLIEALNNLPDSIVLVFIQGAPDKRSSIYKYLAKNANTTEFNELNTLDLEKWITEKVKQKNINISKNNVKYLASLCDRNLWTVNNEIGKFEVYHNEEITKDKIDKLVVPTINSNMFKCLDAITNKNTDTALLEIEKIKQSGESLMQFFSLLIRQVRLLILAKNYSNKSLFAKEQRLAPFVASKIFSKINQHNIQILESIYENLLDIDFKLKTGGIKISSKDERSLLINLEMIILKLTKS